MLQVARGEFPFNLQSTELLELRDESTDILDLATTLAGGGFCASNS